MQLAYPAKLTPDEDGRLVVSFPDLPEALTDGTDRTEALKEATDALAEAIAGRISDKRDIPVPAPARGRPLVPVEPELAGKAALYTAMREQRVTNVALAERLGVTEGAVRKLVSPRHVAKIDTLARALRELGFMVTVSVTPMRPPVKRRGRRVQAA